MIILSKNIKKCESQCPICNQVVMPIQWVEFEGIQWVKCPSCDGGWQVPYVSELDRKQDLLHETYNNYIAIKSAFDSVAEEKSRWIRSHWDENTIVVEVGAGIGAVALALRKNFPEIEYIAVEPSAQFAEHLRLAGLNVETGEPGVALNNALQKVRESEKKVLVFMDNVLEHVEFPKSFIKFLNMQCCSGSKLLIEVPNEAGLGWRAGLQNFLRGRVKAPTFPGHINLFTFNSLEFLLSRSTGSVPKVSFKSIRKTEQVSYLTQNLKLNWKIKIAIFFLNIIPVDSLLGVSYWLRAEVSFRNKSLQE